MSLGLGLQALGALNDGPEMTRESVRSGCFLAVGTGPDGWGQSVVRIGGGSMQARVSVLLIAPFAFKEIKLFLVCATAGETPEEAFPSLRFSRSCQVWSSI